MKPQINYDESQIVPYSLPDPLVFANGTQVKTDQDWFSLRRPELLELFNRHVYGKTPVQPCNTVSFKLHKADNNALDDKAILEEIDIFFTSEKNEQSMRLLLLIPKIGKPVPCFLGLNFFGNMAVSSEPSISMSGRWMRDHQTTVNHKATEKTRGSEASRWPLDSIISRGYAVATAYYGDVDPDFDDGFKNGIHPLFYRKGQTCPDSDEWGSIGAWSWGLSRALDYLETEARINAQKVIAIGHSRLGKAALWAAAQDTRFAMAISNNSGCGGAALSRRNFGENIESITTAFPHWFCGNFSKFSGNEKSLPVDQHELLALIAPRPLYVASATEDMWADPKGEFLAVCAANSVYRFLKTSGFPATGMPKENAPVFGTLGYHLRTGKHDITHSDWQHYMDFSDFHFRAKQK